MKVAKSPSFQNKLLTDLRTLITRAREGFARQANSALVILYWRIGQRIRQDILKKKRGEYGQEIVATLSQQLTVEFGRGFSRFALSRMMLLVEYFPDEKIVATLSQQLGWSHFVEILPIKDATQRDFYAEMCRVEGWSVRILREKITGQLYQRTALAKRPAKQIRQELAQLRTQDKLSPDLVFRDPYLLDFLGLKDTYSEKDLETAILRELENFILELGVGFTFVERQKRITVDGEDYYLDLLFYNRKLRCLVAIELKLGKFKAADKGQMELYLRWLEKHERQAEEDAPIGLILCADKSEEHVELLQLGKSGIRVASYLTELPSRKVLENKLHLAIMAARGRLEKASR